MYKKLYEQLGLQKDIEVPYDVWRLLGSANKKIRIAGDQASFGEDYGTIEELQKAVEFYADQLGGKISWKPIAKQE